MWSQEMRSRGYRVYSFDVCQGPRGDLLRRGVRSCVLRMLRSGMCLGLLAGVPCTSFTRALRQPIRSTACRGGLPNLKASDQSKLDHCNLIFRSAVSYFHACRRYSVPFVWETPGLASCG